MGADILDELELMRFTRIDPIRENAILKRAKDEIGRLRGEVDSLRGWFDVSRAPSNMSDDHDDAAGDDADDIAPAEAKGDLSALERLAWNWKNIDVPLGDVGSSATLERCANELRAVIATMTIPQPACGEAVAEWQVWHKQDGWGATHPDNVAEYSARGVPVRPLYAHPPAPVQAAPQEGECASCETEGVFATDGSGPFDCYACGKNVARHSACELGAAGELGPLTLRRDDDGKLQLYRVGFALRFATFSPGVLESERCAVFAALQHRGDSRGGEG